MRYRCLNYHKEKYLSFMNTHANVFFKYFQYQQYARLYYLEQYTSGEPRKLVQSWFHLPADRGYQEAKEQLEIS